MSRPHLVGLPRLALSSCPLEGNHLWTPCPEAVFPRQAECSVPTPPAMAVPGMQTVCQSKNRATVQIPALPKGLESQALSLATKGESTWRIFEGKEVPYLARYVGLYSSSTKAVPWELHGSHALHTAPPTQMGDRTPGLAAAGSSREHSSRPLWMSI